MYVQSKVIESLRLEKSVEILKYNFPRQTSHYEIFLSAAPPLFYFVTFFPCWWFSNSAGYGASSSSYRLYGPFQKLLDLAKTHENRPKILLLI